MVDLFGYIAVSVVLFSIGLFGIVCGRRSVISVLMSIEMILLAANINFISFSSFTGDVMGQVFAMFVLVVAAAEAAIGLAILVLYFRDRGDIDVESASELKEVDL